MTAGSSAVSGCWCLFRQPISTRSELVEAAASSRTSLMPCLLKGGGPACSHKKTNQDLASLKRRVLLPTERKHMPAVQICPYSAASNFFFLSGPQSFLMPYILSACLFLICLSCAQGMLRKHLLCFHVPALLQHHWCFRLQRCSGFLLEL